MTEKIKQTIIVVIVIIVAFIGFKMFFPGSSGDQTLGTDNPVSEQFADGQVILTLLNKLENVSLDTTVFSDKVFVSLVSFEKSIDEQVAGRANPFLPIGVDGAGSILSRATSTASTTRR